MNVLGSYYEFRPNAPLNGLGRVDPQFTLGLGEQALHDMLVRVQPLGVFKSWGQQSGDVSWNDTKPEWNLQTYGVTDAHLKAAQQAAFGAPVGWVAVLTGSPVKRDLAAEAFQATPYELSEVIGVYRQDDKLPVPRIYFLYWAKARDMADKLGGRESMEATARRLGGKLVFPLHTPSSRSDRSHPALPFARALNAQLTPDAGRGIAPPTGSRSVPGGTQATTGRTGVTWLLLSGVGAVAAFAGFKWFSAKRKRVGATA